MRTSFTSENIKDVIETLFNGNLIAHKNSKGAVPYVNENSETIILTDEFSGESTEVDLAKYLNVTFYTWKQRVVSKGEGSIDEDPELSVFEDWVQSLNFSTNEAYALVEKENEEVVQSQDIDSANIYSKVTMIVQADKVKNLDYYVAKLRNKFLGNVQDIQNEHGELLKSYIVFGALNYEQEPIMTQYGECIVVSFNVKLAYLASAQTFGDTEMSISLDGDDLYNEDGEIVDEFGNPTETKFLTMPITKATWQLIFNCNPVPVSSRPDLTGYVSSSMTTAKTLSFFDYNKELTLKFNDIFWSMGAYRKNGQLTTVKDVNVPVFVRVKNKDNVYVFKDVLERMEKVLTNNDFNICSITLKGWGKIQQ